MRRTTHRQLYNFVNQDSKPCPRANVTEESELHDQDKHSSTSLLCAQLDAEFNLQARQQADEQVEEVLDTPTRKPTPPSKASLSPGGRMRRGLGNQQATTEGKSTGSAVGKRELDGIESEVSLLINR